jgi:hypothetical protein
MEERPFTERGNGPPAEAYRRSSCMTRSRWSISAPCMLKRRHKEGFGKPNLIPTCSLVSGSVAAHRAVTRAPSASRLCSVIRFAFADIFPVFVPKSRALQHFSDDTHATRKEKFNTVGSQDGTARPLLVGSISNCTPTSVFSTSNRQCFLFQMCFCSSSY